MLAVVPFLEIFNLNEKLSHAMLTPLAAGSHGAAEWRAVWEYVGWSGLYALAYVVFAIGLGAACSVVGRWAEGLGRPFLLLAGLFQPAGAAGVFTEDLESGGPIGTVSHPSVRAAAR